MADLIQSGKVQPQQTGPADLTWKSSQADEWIQIDIQLSSSYAVAAEAFFYDPMNSTSVINVEFSTNGFYGPLQPSLAVHDSSAVYDIWTAGSERGFASHAFNPDAFAWTNDPFTTEPAFDIWFDGDAYQSTTINKAVFVDAGSIYPGTHFIQKKEVSPTHVDAGSIYTVDASNALQQIDGLLIDDAQVYSNILAFNKIQYVEPTHVDASSVATISTIALTLQSFNLSDLVDTSQTSTPAAFNLKQVFTFSAVDFVSTDAIHLPAAWNLDQYAQSIMVESGATYQPTAWNLNQYADYNLVDADSTFAPTAFNWDQYVTAIVLDADSTFAPTAFNWDQYVDAVGMNTHYIYDAAAFNSTTFVTAVEVASGQVNAFDAWNWTTVVDALLVDAGIVSDITQSWNSMQDYLAEQISLGSVYDIESIALLRNIVEPVVVDDGTAHIIAAFNALQVFDAATVTDASNVHVPSAFNAKQIFDAVLIDTASTHAGNAFNWDQYNTSLLVDGQSIFAPQASNVDQWFTAVNVSDSLIHAASAFNQDQWVAVDAIDPGTVGIASAFNHDQWFTAVNVSDSLIHAASAFNLTQIFSSVMIDGFTSHTAQADNALRQFAFDVFDSGNAFAPSAQNKNTWIVPQFMDAATVHAPHAYKTLVDTSEPLFIDAFAAYAPTQTNWDSMLAIGSTIEGTSLHEFNASNWVQEFQANVLVDSAVLTDVVIENRNRTVYGILHSDSSVFDIDVANIDREFHAELYQDGSVFDVPYADIFDRTYEGIFVDAPGAIIVDKVFNLKTVVDIASVETFSVFSPTAFAKTAADAACLFQTGEMFMPFDLTTNANHKMVAFAHDGAGAVASMETSAPASMAGAGISGESASCSLVFAFLTFSNIQGNSGEHATCGAMGTEPLMFMYSGEQASSSLMTQMLIDAEMLTGEHVQTSLDTHESWPLGSVNMVSGLYSDATLTTQYAGQSLKPYVIGVDAVFKASMNRPWELDMARDECCSPPHKVMSHMNVNVEMGNYDDLFEVYYGDKLWASASLSCNHLLSATAHEGTSLLLRDTPVFNMGANTFTAAETMSCVLVLDNKWQHKLCKGNFVGQGADVSVEMLDLLDDSCEDIRMVDGSMMSVSDLSTNTQFQAIAWTESTMAFDLYLQQWSATFMAMARMDVDLSTSTQLFPAPFVAGESASAVFENPTIVISAGETMRADITIHHVVEFTEAGGVGNEHISINPDGSINLENTFDIAIEGYYFRHDLKSWSR